MLGDNQQNAFKKHSWDRWNGFHFPFPFPLRKVENRPSDPRECFCGERIVCKPSWKTTGCDIGPGGKGETRPNVTGQVFPAVTNDFLFHFRFPLAEMGNRFMGISAINKIPKLPRFQ